MEAVLLNIVLEVSRRAQTFSALPAWWLGNEYDQSIYQIIFSTSVANAASLFSAENIVFTANLTSKGTRHVWDLCFINKPPHNASACIARTTYAATLSTDSPGTFSTHLLLRKNFITDKF